MIAKTPRSYFRYFTAGLAIVILCSDTNLQAQTTSSRLKDAYGLRLGVVANAFWNSVQPLPNTFDAPPATSGVRPLLNPYYEVSLLPGLTATANLMLVYRSMAALGLSDFRFQSYGFNFSMRWEPEISHGGTYDQRHYFLGAGLGFDTFTDRVSVSLPLTAGELFPLSQSLQLEVGGLVTMQDFLDLGPGMYYGITVGVRFLNFE